MRLQQLKKPVTQRLLARLRSSPRRKLLTKTQRRELKNPHRTRSRHPLNKKQRPVKRALLRNQPMQLKKPKPRRRRQKMTRALPRQKPSRRRGCHLD